MIIDSHAHYDDEAFDIDREELFEKLLKNEIEAVINVGSSLESCKTTLELIQKYSYFYGAVGVHPSETEELDEKSFQWLKEQCTEKKIVAIGEIGLDYYWKEPESSIQKKWFEKQLYLAQEVRLPVIIHSRDAAKDTYEMMQACHAEKSGGVVHCFSYSKEMAQKFLNMGYYFGIGGVITFTNARKLKEVVEYLPMDRILLETDCPYLSPVPNRGKRNSSLNLPYVIEEISKIKGISYDEIAEITKQNTKTLFHLI